MSEEKVKVEDRIEVEDQVSKENPEATISEEDALKILEESLKASQKEAAEAQEKLKVSDERLQAAASQYIRLQADFDNYRRRTKENEGKAEDTYTSKVLKDFLPVLDNFDLALNQMKKVEGENGEAYVKGFELLHKQFQKIMDSFGVKEIEALGQTFDPNFHEAVMMIPDESKKDEEIANVFQKGYMYKETVLRPAKVQVVRND